MKSDMPTWQLSGFGDEIDDDPAIQVAVLQALGARHIEVRSAWGTNIVDMTSEDLATLASLLDATSMKVSAIASPIGKVDLKGPVDAEIERLDNAIRAAKALGTSYIRVFSFYYGDAEPDAVREPVLERMRALAGAAERSGVVLLHENEKLIYGDTPDRVLDVVESVNSPALRVAWDAANFVQVGVKPFDEAYEKLRPYLDYLQVKDAQLADGEVVPAGEGDGDVRLTVEALRDSGYEGFVSLEPHLADAFGLGGFSGPEAFGTAARALRTITDDAGIRLN